MEINPSLRDVIESLSHQQKNIFVLIALGRSNSEIAQTLRLTKNSVSVLISNLYCELGLNLDRRILIGELYTEAVKNGWLGHDGTDV